MALHFFFPSLHKSLGNKDPHLTSECEKKNKTGLLGVSLCEHVGTGLSLSLLFHLIMETVLYSEKSKYN